ncbi:hypothetical protein Cch01nite_17080 [Cellulomonas chitinilytica]|uniref:Uncharacterized protein n=1 Tax=Cellulomonas chitinilytica TaxID=398759 RepID=A0A919P4Q0_9CELL|nr:hypothetical protein [Cellulomonas chitinilytica]GIG20984.1 hypothetical protein Cch01nite_17080 [Cellulomonas chitinilytica]
MSTSTLSREDRALLARAVLARAELRTGARSTRTGTDGRSGAAGAATAAVVVPPAVPPVVPVTADASTDDDEPPALALVEPLPDEAPAARPTSLITTERPPMPVPPPLLPLLPDGLRRGATTAVLGSTSLVLTVLAHACAGGSWAAVVGQPTIGLLAAAQAGVALDRLAVVPRPGAEAPTVVAALVDGMDVVVVGPEAALTDADRRRLSARARDRGAVLLSTVDWPGASTVLTVEAGRWTGAGAGDGRLRTHELRVTRSGRGSSATPLSADLTLPLGAADDLVVAGRADDDAPATSAPGLRLVG